MASAAVLRSLLPIIAVVTLLAACTPIVADGAGGVDAADTPRQSPPMSTPTPPATREPCDASKAQLFIGQQASADVQARARTASGARIVRTLKPGQPITLEYSGERLNLHIDNAGNVVSANCG